MLKDKLKKVESLLPSIEDKEEIIKKIFTDDQLIKIQDEQIGKSKTHSFYTKY